MNQLNCLGLYYEALQQYEEYNNTIYEMVMRNRVDRKQPTRSQPQPVEYPLVCLFLFASHLVVLFVASCADHRQRRVR